MDRSSPEYVLQHVADTLSRQLDQVILEQIGIGLSQYKILQALHADPEVRQHHIASRLGQTEASISRQIKLLKERGLLVSSVNPRNRREHLHAPTALGVKMLDNAATALNKYASGMFGAVGDKQRKQFIEALTVFHAWTCQPGKPYGCDHLLATEDHSA